MRTNGFSPVQPTYGDKGSVEATTGFSQHPTLINFTGQPLITRIYFSLALYNFQ